MDRVIHRRGISSFQYGYKNRLGKMKRWVLGQKIDISSGLDEYENALHFARILNSSMGYLNEKEFSSKKYLKQVRELNNINKDWKVIHTPKIELPRTSGLSNFFAHGLPCISEILI